VLALAEPSPTDGLALLPPDIRFDLPSDVHLGAAPIPQLEDRRRDEAATLAAAATAAEESA
jgi:hypothetical protein